MLAIIGRPNTPPAVKPLAWIVPTRKGQEGKGFMHFAIQRVSDGMFLNADEVWLPAKQSHAVSLFPTKVAAKKEADRLGMQVVELELPVVV